jgi:hypothetical protein
MLDTLPERLTLARQQKMAHVDFLELTRTPLITFPEVSTHFQARVRPNTNPPAYAGLDRKSCTAG